MLRGISESRGNPAGTIPRGQFHEANKAWRVSRGGKGSRQNRKVELVSRGEGYSECRTFVILRSTFHEGRGAIVVGQKAFHLPHLTSSISFPSWDGGSQLGELGFKFHIPQGEDIAVGQKVFHIPLGGGSQFGNALCMAISMHQHDKHGDINSFEPTPIALWSPQQY